MWRLVREMLWRLIDPSLGFGFVVRRALFTHRIVRILQVAPQSTAQLVLGVARIAARRTATRPLAMPSGHACRLCPHSPPPAATLVRQSTSRAVSEGREVFYLGVGPL